jgi:hypothetical protein
MSNPKITPKNLSYDTTLPPFLARLQASNSNTSGRHEYTIARPRKERTAEDIAEDEPVYFDEGTGETLTKGEWEEREKDHNPPGEEDKKSKDENANLEDTKEEVVKAKEEKTAGIGGSKKRKVGKVIGGSEDEGEAYEKAKKHINQQSTKSNEKPDSKPEIGPKKAGSKKKGKKIKLSFGDEE